jgi:hypothetical protein
MSNLKLMSSPKEYSINRVNGPFSLQYYNSNSTRECDVSLLLIPILVVEHVNSHFIHEMHRRRWIMGDICAENLYLSDNTGQVRISICFMSFNHRYMCDVSLLLIPILVVEHVNCNFTIHKY